MKTLSRIWCCLIGILGVAHGLFAQSPNEVYRNELIGLMIRYEGSEGGYDWAFTQTLPTPHVVSFDYKGSSVTLRGLTGQRFVRAQNPLPSGFKLSHNDVIVDGFPATNYNDYMNYKNGLYDAINQIGQGARGTKQGLQDAIKVIDYKIEEIRKQDRRFQVSAAFRKRHALEGYIEMLESKRTSFEDDIRQLDQKSQSSNIVITGNNTSNKGTQNASSSSSVPPSATQSDDIRAASSFEGGLAGIAEGEVFKNDRGEYYQKVNGAARKIDKSDYDRMEANRIAAQMASREAERQERDAAFSRAAEDLTTLGANALMSIRADREARLDREYAAQSRAEEILKSYKSLAADGNIEALKKVNNAYYTLAYYNKEEKGGWTGRYSVERETFLKNTANNTGSLGAQELLVDFYESQKDQAISRQNKAIYRGIAYPLLGGGLFYGGYKIYDSILQDDDGSQEWLGTTMLSIGVVSGLTFGLWGLYEALSATPLGAYAGRKSAGYKEADAKQKALGKRVSWQISPKYDLYNQATLISLNVTF